MRIDTSQILAQGGLRVSGNGSAENLRGGEKIRAHVISNSDGLVELKSENGQMIKAKLDAAVSLMPGDQVELEVSGGGKELSLVSVGREQTDINETSARAAPLSAPQDNRLEPYLNKLTSLNMPATKEAAGLMQDILANNPRLSPEQAAFLASNKLSGSGAAISAALKLISGGEKTDAMILKLINLLGTQGDPAAAPQSNQSDLLLSKLDAIILNEAPAASLETASAQPGAFEARNGGAAAQQTNTAPLTDLLNTIIKGGETNAKAHAPAEALPNQPTSPIVSYVEGDLQSTIAKNISNNAQDYAQSGVEGGAAAATPESGAADVTAKAALPMAQPTHEGSITAPAENAADGAHSTPQTGSGEVLQNELPAPPAGKMAEQTLMQNGIQAGADIGTADALNVRAQELPAQITALETSLTSLLSGIEEFSNTPPEALDRFSNMLVRIAGENAAAAGSEAEKLEALLDKLFTSIEKGDEQAGAKLKEARQELFARLALIEEAISKSSPSGRAEMISQVQRVMEHVRVLNNIESFAYMQLPVKLGEQRKAADLYVFKRKGGKKPDPENVNILLAIDLENMGHWESLINVKGQDVSLSMEVAGEKEKEHFSENTVLLHDMLAQAGFKLVNTDIAYLKKETTPLTALNALERLTSAKTGRIDFMF